MVIPKEQLGDKLLKTSNLTEEMHKLSVEIQSLNHAIWSIRALLVKQMDLQYKKELHNGYDNTINIK